MCLKINVASCCVSLMEKRVSKQDIDDDENDDDDDDSDNNDDNDINGNEDFVEYYDGDGDDID